MVFDDVNMLQRLFQSEIYNDFNKHIVYKQPLLALKHVLFFHKFV